MLDALTACGLNSEEIRHHKDESIALEFVNIMAEMAAAWGVPPRSVAKSIRKRILQRWSDYTTLVYSAKKDDLDRFLTRVLFDLVVDNLEVIWEKKVDSGERSALDVITSVIRLGSACDGWKVNDGNLDLQQEVL